MNWLQRLFGARPRPRATKSRPNRARLGLEGLESREVLTAGLSPHFGDLVQPPTGPVATQMTAQQNINIDHTQQSPSVARTNQQTTPQNVKVGFGQTQNAGLQKLQGGSIQAAATQTPAATTPIVTGLGSDIDRLIGSSPTLASNIQMLQANGWTLSYGAAGGGSSTSRPMKTITIDGNEMGQTLAVLQTLSHETGHALYTPDPFVPPDGLTKQEFIDKNVMSNLKDEGEATLMNIQIKDEFLANLHANIGIAGAQADQYQTIYNKFLDLSNPVQRDQARTEIGQVFGHGEHPSTNPALDYYAYYAKAYSDFWDKTHP